MPIPRYKLYGDHRSGNCYKAALLLKLTGREYEWVETDVLSAATRTPEFLTKNPNGKVPLLELPDGRYLAESNAMLLHLAKGTRYLPADPYEEALAYQWLFFEQYSHEPYIAVARFLLHFDHGMDVSEARMEMLHQRGNQALGVMETALAGQEFFAGPRYSVADIALYAYTHVAGEGGFVTAAFPRVSAWMDRIRAQPGHFDMRDMPA